jgi:hypothetical protein
LGSLINFPPTGAKQSDGKGHDPADKAPRALRSSSESSLVTWSDAKRQRDSEDDGDGGSAA